jgi:hypothetical protein
MGKKTFFGIVLIFVVTLTTSAFAQSFSTSDFAGNWHAYVIEVNLSSVPPVYWLRGNMNIDASGNISGTYYGPDGSSVTLSGGQLALDQKGVVTGSFTAEGQTATIVHGKLDSSKTYGVGIMLGEDGSMDIATFVKGGGTFAQSDLEGTWYVYPTIIDATTGGIYWARGTLSVDSQGNVTGSFTGPDGTPVNITSGALTLNSAGIIGGSFALDIGQTVSIAHGKLDQSKTIGTFVSVEPNFTMALGNLVKAGGTFKQSDAAGNWYVYGLNIVPPPQPAVFWLYGDDARVDASGNITGSFTPPMGDSIGGSGAASIDSNGVIFGEFSFDTGDAGVGYFKMDQRKTIIDGVTVTESGAMAIWQYIKASSIPLPSLPLLLLGD